ncbi:hypothetical protein [Arenibacter sp. F20364]|uniref:hypothetical protein n=1 Tax=Arenibacter sp. F20364 TaxID=2926415 RepID=UPI001FF6F4C6|nr:hypothetical protein [Arenibacter sp. F20364]MCK0192518.1 hypothetical protein [Arenibacter sp. F20364]
MKNTTEKIKIGFWESKGKNPFWLNVVGDDIYWLGMNQKTEEFKLGENWCHVGFGKLKNNIIELTWSDIPVGKDCLYGKIKIEIIDKTHLIVIEDSGNFGKSEWKWVDSIKNFSKI